MKKKLSFNTSSARRNSVSELAYSKELICDGVVFAELPALELNRVGQMRTRGQKHAADNLHG